MAINNIDKPIVLKASKCYNLIRTYVRTIREGK